MDALLNAMDGPYKGEWVTNLSEGIERLKGAEMWAVFVNLMLPDSQGLATLDNLLLAAPGVPTLILASTKDATVALEALRHGANDYLLEDHLDRDSVVRAIRNMAQRQTAREILSAEERAQMTLNSIRDAVLSINLEGRITYLNAVAEKITGWTKEEASARDVEDVFVIIDGCTRKPCLNPLKTAMEQNKTVSVTPHCILIRRDGDEFGIEDSAAPIHLGRSRPSMFARKLTRIGADPTASELLSADRTFPEGILLSRRTTFADWASLPHRADSRQRAAVLGVTGLQRRRSGPIQPDYIFAEYLEATSASKRLRVLASTVHFRSILLSASSAYHSRLPLQISPPFC
jgi:PAS domain S-box-containing protein